jgi:hypothetical protein
MSRPTRVALATLTIGLIMIGAVLVGWGVLA